MRLSTTVLLAAALALPTGCKDRAQVQKEQEALNEIEASGQELRESLKKGLSEDGLEVDHAVLEKQQQAIEAASRKMGGKKGEALKVLAGIQAESNAISKEIERETEQFLTVLDWSGLQAEGNYDERRKRSRDFAAFNQGVIEFFGSRPQELKKRFDEIDFKGRDRDDIEKGFNGQFVKMNSMIRQIRQCDITCSEIAVRMVDILEQNKGKWSWNAEAGHLEFNEDSAKDAFNKEFLELQKIGSRQIELQTQIVNELQ